jgi:membrane-bound ClpP family serine protease
VRFVWLGLVLIGTAAVVVGLAPIGFGVFGIATVLVAALVFRRLQVVPDRFVWLLCFVLIAGTAALIVTLVMALIGVVGIGEAFFPESCRSFDGSFCYSSSKEEWTLRIIGFVLLAVATLLGWLAFVLWRAVVRSIRNYLSRRRSYIGSSG